MGSTSQNHLGLGITTISSIKHGSYTIQNSHQTSSTSLPGLLLCWSKNYIAAYATLFSVCRAPNRAPMRAFFSRFVVHQIVLQCVLSFRGLSCTKSCSNACMLFFTACRAPTHAPVRAVFRGLSCTNSCSNACFFSPFSAPNRAPNTCFFSRFVVHQTVLQCVLFFCGLSCTKSCSNACFFSLFVVHQIVLQCVFLFFPFFSRFVVHQIVLQCVFFFAVFVVRQIMLQCVLLFAVYRAPNRAVWSQYMSQLCWKSVLLLLFYSFSGNEKSAAKPKTGGFVLFSSSELRPGSGRSKASLQNRNLEEYWITEY